MSNFVWSNNCSLTIAGSGLSSGATSVTLSSSLNVPVLTAGQVWALTFSDVATRSNFEIVYVTATAGNVCTILRGQEGTTAQSWLNGDLAYGAVTAGQLADFVQAGTGGSFVELSPGSPQAGYISMNGTITATGDIDSGGDISATGNVGAATFTGSGSSLSGVIHTLTQGAGIGIAGGSNPTITNTGVRSLNGQLNADVTLASTTLTITASGGTVQIENPGASSGLTYVKQKRPTTAGSTGLTLPTLPGTSSQIYDLYAWASADSNSGGAQELAGSGATWESGSVILNDGGALGSEPIDYIGTAEGGQAPAVTYTLTGVGATGYIGVFGIQAVAR